MSSILITGGSGFIGRYVVKALSEAGHQLFVLVRSKEKLFAALDAIGWDSTVPVFPLLGDLTLPSLGLSPKDREQLMSVDIIIHAGGPMDILLDADEARRVFLNASQEMASLAEAIHAAHGLQHFIHVVGFKSPYSERDAEAYTHSPQTHNLPPYEKMKFAADLLIRQSMASLGIPLSVINPGVVIGDSVTGITEQTGGLGILIDAVRRNLMPVTPGNRDYWLPLVHVDYVAAFMTALTAEEHPTNHTYFLLDEQAQSQGIIGLVQRIAKELRSRGPVGSVPHRIVQALLGSGIGKWLRLPQESLDFIVNTSYPAAARKTIEAKYDLQAAVSEPVLPAVIADLDYRISHGSTPLPSPFRYNQRSKLATLESAGTGTPVIIVHGTLSNAFSLLPVARPLAAAGHPVYLVDLPGFGRSPYHHQPGIIEGHVKSVADLVSSFGGGVNLIGHSFGGYLAARVMEQMPERINQLILLQPTLQPVPAIYKSAVRNDLSLRLLSKTALQKSMIKHGAFAGAAEIPDRYMNHLYNELKSPRVRKTTAQVMAALAKSNAVQLDPDNWDCSKVSILWGTLDPIPLPSLFDSFNPIRLPYAHQFPVAYPDASANKIKECLS